MELVVATRNKGKLLEFQRILAPLGIQVLSQEALCPDLAVEETGATFGENARLKAQAVARQTGLAAVADDSGLCVDALDGAPGVYSARYAGPAATDAQRMEKLLQELAHVPEQGRSARFVCAICCVLPGGTLVECEGACQGTVGWEPVGTDGFGYDPIFMVGQRSFAQLTPEEKDSISHRGKALALFYQTLKENLC